MTAPTDRQRDGRAPVALPLPETGSVSPAAPVSPTPAAPAFARGHGAAGPDPGRGGAGGPDPGKGGPPKPGKRRPKDIGTDAERAVVRYLQGNGWPGAERRALRGRGDAGDITGTPGVAWEVKSRGRSISDAQVDAWLCETQTERLNARADVGVLVLRRPGYGPANARSWWAVMWAGAWDLSAPPSTIPVRMILADACWLLRRNGWGDPIEGDPLEVSP